MLYDCDTYSRAAASNAVYTNADEIYSRHRANVRYRRSLARDEVIRYNNKPMCSKGMDTVFIGLYGIRAV